MLRFFRDHVASSLVLVCSAALSVGSRVNDAYSLFNAGLPGAVWEAIGLAIFFCTLMTILVRWYQVHPQYSPSQSAEQLEQPKQRTSSNYLSLGAVYAGSPNPYRRPWFSGKFAKRGKLARIFLDYSYFVGQSGVDWSHCKRIYLGEVANFVPEQSVQIEILSQYKSEDRKLWRWGPEEKSPQQGYAFLDQHSYRGRVVVFCDDAKPEHCYFVILPPTDLSEQQFGFPKVVGYHMFDFVSDWEAENGTN